MKVMFSSSVSFINSNRDLMRWSASILFMLCALSGWAYPPAPHHLLYGLVRDEYGSPMNVVGAEVILVTPSGRELKAKIADAEPGVNYRLEVPMDAGLTYDVYKPTALQPTMPFQLKVVINKVTYLPIELKGKPGTIGEPGQKTLLDLTLGEDKDGDGLPDAWERMINRDITKVNPGDVNANGLTNLQDYLTGTYALTSSDGLKLNIAEVRNGEPVMKFMGVTGHAYTLLGSTDFVTWTPVSFRIPAEGATAVVRSSYLAANVAVMEVQSVTLGLASVPTFFKLQIR